MNKEQFLALKPNQASLDLLRAEADKHQNDSEFEFWVVVVGSLVGYRISKSQMSWSTKKVLELLRSDNNCRVKIPQRFL